MERDRCFCGTPRGVVCNAPMAVVCGHVQEFVEALLPPLTSLHVAGLRLVPEHVVPPREREIAARAGVTHGQE
eukprot:130445-Rhodomonas_salina.2